jgi:hypothetical protein
VTTAWRKKHIARIERFIEARRHPRLMLFVIVLLTGITAFAASLLFWHLGVAWMWLRYPMTVTLAYIVFVLLVWLWLRSQEDHADVPDLSSLDPGALGSSGHAGECVHGAGGDFAGAGASAGFDSGAATEVAATGGSGVTRGVAEVAVHGAAAAGEGCAVVLLVGLIGLVIGGLFFGVLAFAPGMLAEFALDAALMTLLYRRMRRPNEPYLWRAIVRRSRAAFIATAVVASVAGAMMQWVAPHTTTLGEFWHHVQTVR